MKTLKFKTNIKCGGCVATVTPFLNEEKSIANWSVDTNNPDKVLTVSGEDLEPQQVEDAVRKAGYQAQVLQIAGTSGKDL